MPALICGSLAFDTITTFPGRFADQIMPEQVHILNVSFLVPTLRREFGGCAGNIAYNLQALGGQPVILGALGIDGGDYLARVQAWGADTSLIHRDAQLHTAQCHITTDRDNNQIAAFHPGAMSQAHEMAVPTRAVRDDLAIGIIAPDGRDAMWQHAQQMAEQQIPFIFDPGQQLPQFNGEEHRQILGMARWVAVNDYEARMLEERTDVYKRQPSKRPGHATSGPKRVLKARHDETRHAPPVPGWWVGRRSASNWPRTSSCPAKGPPCARRRNC